MGGARPVVAFAGHHFAQDGPSQVVDDVVGELAAFVKALVDDHRFFADLREEVAIEAGITSAGGVGHIDVGHAASGCLVNGAAIAFNPRPMAQILLAINRHYSDLTRVFTI